MSEEFGEILQGLRLASGLTRTQLTASLSFGSSDLSRWERGFGVPDSAQIEEIVTALKLTSAERAKLLAACGVPSLAPEVLRPVTESSISSSSATEKGRELQVQIADLRDAFEGIVASFDREGRIVTASPQDDVSELRRLISDLQVSARGVRAPVILPSEKELEVRLVLASSIERLEEYRAESSKWSSWASLFFGGIAGILVNLVTGGSLSMQTWVVLVIFSLVGSLLASNAIGKNRKAREVADSMRPAPPPHSA